MEPCRARPGPEKHREGGTRPAVEHGRHRIPAYQPSGCALSDRCRVSGHDDPRGQEVEQTREVAPFGSLEEGVDDLPILSLIHI